MSNFNYSNTVSGRPNIEESLRHVLRLSEKNSISIMICEIKLTIKYSQDKKIVKLMLGITWTKIEVIRYGGQMNQLSI